MTKYIQYAKEILQEKGTIDKRLNQLSYWTEQLGKSRVNDKETAFAEMYQVGEQLIDKAAAGKRSEKAQAKIDKAVERFYAALPVNYRGDDCREVMGEVLVARQKEGNLERREIATGKYFNGNSDHINGLSAEGKDLFECPTKVFDYKGINDDEKFNFAAKYWNTVPGKEEKVALAGRLQPYLQEGIKETLDQKARHKYMQLKCDVTQCLLNYENQTLMPIEVGEVDIVTGQFEDAEKYLDGIRDSTIKKPAVPIEDTIIFRDVDEKNLPKVETTLLGAKKVNLVPELDERVFTSYSLQEGDLTRCLGSVPTARPIIVDYYDDIPEIGTTSLARTDSAEDLFSKTPIKAWDHPENYQLPAVSGLISKAARWIGINGAILSLFAAYAITLGAPGVSATIDHEPIYEKVVIESVNLETDSMEREYVAAKKPRKISAMKRFLTRKARGLPGIHAVGDYRPKRDITRNDTTETGERLSTGKLELGKKFLLQASHPVSINEAPEVRTIVVEGRDGKKPDWHKRYSVKEESLDGKDDFF